MVLGEFILKGQMNMKKIIKSVAAIGACVLMLSAAPVFAEEAVPVDAAEPIAETAVNTVKSNLVSVDFIVPEDYLSISDTAVFELCDMNGNVIAWDAFNVTQYASRVTLNFEIQEYNVGESFQLRLVSGLDHIQYYDQYIYCGQSAVINTYYYYDGSNPVIGNTFSMTAVPRREKEIHVYKNNAPLNFSPRPRLINDTLMVPLSQACFSLGIYDVVRDYNYNSVKVAFNGKELLFNIGDTYNSVNGNAVYGGEPTQVIDGVIYAPLRVLADVFNASLAAYDHGYYMDILLGDSADVKWYNTKVNYVNSAGLTSDTNYLIWISKANYEVNVYQKINYGWQFVKAIPCTIGASGTPTCTGTYKYYEKISRWTYPNFYVGPIMRFNKGYAIHTTLLKYDGTDYNNTVGKKLSHGCVRVRPDEMNWLINNIPMYTTIHVTDY